MPKKANKTYWFRAKKYGWGWGTPLTWQGWLSFGTALVIWLAALAFLVVLPDQSEPIPSTNVVMLVCIIVLDVLGLTYVSFKYGESPKWRWGNKKKK